MRKLRHARCASALGVVLLFILAAFSLLAFHERSFDAGALLLAALYRLLFCYPIVCLRVLLRMRTDY